ncbi:MAG: bifunctional metallophosphatase/5'-nucleotidase [Myxococcales bacterium]|nr:bifunctional metallophosphatase/5'-nucleotidase [Myxococcales bacterium]
MTWVLRTFLFALVAMLTTGIGCAPTEGTTVDLRGKRVRLTIVHTSDIHSRLFPYPYTPLTPDKAAGMQDGKGPYGGLARMAYVAKRERLRADRSIHIDGGDVSQGAPIYNYFSGEAEFRALAEMGIDAMVIANHEFDRGAANVTFQIQRWATFPVLAANYLPDDPSFPGASPIGTALRPYTILNVKGLRVAVIGFGNLSTITSLFEVPNRLGLSPWKTRDIAQFYIDLLRPQADLIVAVTHLGLEIDEELIKETEGLDVVLGGHNHIVVSPPKQVWDCGGADALTGVVEVPSVPGGETIVKRACKPRRVLLMHSGAFAKFVGRLDVDLADTAAEVNSAYEGRNVYDPVNGFEILAHDVQVFPIDADVPEDRQMVQLLEPYKQALKDVGQLDLLVGYAPADVRRTAPAGGDSQLGNLIGTSMWLRLGVQTDFAMTNTTGIRSDVTKGPVTLEQMFNVFPFDNSITKMQVSGSEVYEMFDFVARRSAQRGCSSQVQVAGARLVLDCNQCDSFYRDGVTSPKALSPTDPCAEQVFIGHTSQNCKEDRDCDAKTDPTGVKLKGRNACDKPVGKCWSPVSTFASYELATSNYLAGGGSGFRVLQRNTTQFDTKIQQRDAAADFIRYGRPCGWQSKGGTGGLLVCSTDADCAGIGDFVCACPSAGGAVASSSPLTCQTTASCGGTGRCVLRDCRDDVANTQAENCKGLEGGVLASCRAESCIKSGEMCKQLACIDASIGALVDARQIMLGR